MRFISTRDPEHRVTLSAAIERGIAPDGGLYVPESFPRLIEEDLEDPDTLHELGVQLLAPFFAGDPLEGELRAICREALDFPIPLRPLRGRTAVLELFHGPTAAFKDIGARFLAACVARLNRQAERPLTVLVATSGDTGGAVAAAFHGRPGVEVVVLYPKGMVSPRQEKQLTCWGGNVTALRVAGDFDDCQRLVKEAFADVELRERRRLTSANSINVGRLLPQMIYHAAASLRYRRRQGIEPGFIVPTGNLGNAVACLWARAMGLPIREVVLAVNANRAIAELLENGRWEPRATVATLASAMDVGNPSNMERVWHLFPGVQEVRENLHAFAVVDEEIREQIRSGPHRWGEVWDPHTATAAAVRERLDTADWILVATAHPAKFEQVVEPLIGREVPPPPDLAALLERPSHAVDLVPTLDALRAALP
ncbi:MAG TPA: threonine synthase [Longimicrobiaceae bacterium]|nr:threonine synthase [Longimicrobiaceae bacterium]